MPRRNFRNTGFGSQVTLELEGRELLRCAGIQPLVTEGGVLEKSSIFFTGRRPKRADWAMCGNAYPFEQYYELSRRDALHNAEILESCIDDAQVEGEVFRRMWKEGGHYDHKGGSAKGVLEALRQHYYNIRLSTFGASIGKTVYTDSPAVADSLRGVVAFKVVLIDGGLLPKNTVLVSGARKCVYGNPLVACPVIPAEDLRAFCIDNNLDLSQIAYDSGKKYPLIEMALDWYEVYSLYLNHHGVDSWYLESFSRMDDYYHFLHFKELC